MSIQPFLKWPGGKRLLLKHILHYLPTRVNRYFEPFLGGAAVFFAMCPESAFLADANHDLINTYQQVRDHVDSVIDRLDALRINKDEFYRLRSILVHDPIDKAVRFLYLNKTAFNGLYRVNLRGEFNVPFGCKDGTVLCEPSVLREASAALQNARLSAGDFGTSFRKVRAGDLVYCDPPYTVKHANNGFRKYNEAIFSWTDQERLAAGARRLIDRGAYIIVSNAYHRDVLALYPGFRAVKITRSSVISAKPSARGVYEEFIFVSENCFDNQ